MNMAKREIDDFALDVKAKERREAAAKTPEEAFFRKVYPGQRFDVHGNRRFQWEVTELLADGVKFVRVDLRDGSKSTEILASRSSFYGMLPNPPTL